MTKSDAELLAEAIKAVIGKDDPALQALLEDLLDMEQQVAHMARPHRILLNIEGKLKAHLGGGVMVLFTQLKVENFKRFKGEHTLPLRGEGPITVIAAEMGGKTTVLDAFYLALHGEKGMKQRKQDPRSTSLYGSKTPTRALRCGTMALAKSVFVSR